MSIEHVIQSLDDANTETIKREGWMLDKLFANELRQTMATYDEALAYAESLLPDFEVGIRSTIISGVVYWEVYIHH